VTEPLVDDLVFDTTSRVFPVGFAQPLSVSADDLASLRFLRRDEETGELQVASAYTGVSLPQDQCVWWSDTCDTSVPTDISFTSSNPRVARFVAARRGSGDEGPRRPEIVIDASGHVVDDPRGVFCPLTTGATDISVTTAGRRVTTTIQVVELSNFGIPDEVKITPIAPGTCGFPDFVVTKPKEKEDVAPIPTPGPLSPVIPQPIFPQPVQPPAPAPSHPAPQPAAPAPPAVPAPVPVPAPLPPPPAIQSPPSDAAHPPVVPAGKPPAPPAPPAPPSGLAVQSAPATQVQFFQAAQVQEQRRVEQAFEADSAAVAYAHPPSPLPWEIIGGAAVIALALAGGTFAGRARRPALARATVAARPPRGPGSRS
jgi:hypothetical protein